MVEYGESSELAAELALEEGGGTADGWYQGVAFTILVLSVITAMSALLAGMSAHETLLDRTEEIVDVQIYEADRVTLELLRTKHQLQEALGVSVASSELVRVETLEVQAEEFQTEAEAAEASALNAAAHHLLLAIAATIAAVAIAVTGMAPIVHKRWLWYAGMVIGGVASVFLLSGAIGFIV